MKLSLTVSLCLLFSCCNHPDNCMTIESSTSSYRTSTGELFHLTEYVLTNHTENSYYTWIDFDKPNRSSYSKEESIKRFFTKPHGDFSFLSLLTDNVHFDGGFTPEIGYSFIALIPPQKSFSYIVCTYNNNEGSMEIVPCIDYAPINWVNSNIVSIDNDFIYKCSSVIIDDSVQ